MLAPSTAKQIDLTGLLKAAGFLLSAGVALVVTAIGPPDRDKTPRLISRMAGLLTAVFVGLIWTFWAEPFYRDRLAGLALSSALITLAVFIAYFLNLIARPATSMPKPASYLLYLLLAVTGPTALSATALLSMLPKPLRVDIREPLEGSCLGSNLLVRGTWSELPPEAHIWLVVEPVNAQPSTEGIFFPEDSEVHKYPDGKWDWTLRYRPEDQTQSFYILAVVATGKAQDDTLRKYAASSERLGLREWPDGTIIADRRKIVKVCGAPESRCLPQE